MKIKLCATFDAALDAAMTLCGHPYIVAECSPSASSLSYLCLTTPIASMSKTIYAFNLSTVTSDLQVLSIITALLTRASIIKVVWNGRPTYRNIISTLGVAISPVLDLQMLEIIERTDKTHNRGHGSESSWLAAFGSRLFYRTRDTLAGTYNTVLSVEAYVSQRVPDAPQPSLTKKFKRDPGLLPLGQMSSSVHYIAYIMRSFTFSGLLPDIKQAELTEIVDGLQLLLERSKRYITLDNDVDRQITFDQQMFPVIARARLSTDPSSTGRPVVAAAVLQQVTGASSLSSSSSSPVSVPHELLAGISPAESLPSTLLCRKVYRYSDHSDIIEYEFCATSTAILSAITTLTQYPYVLLSCIGMNIGLTDGELSVLCLGTPILVPDETNPDAPSQRIFLVDVLELSEITDTAPCAAIADLLSSPIIKIVWDGRMDAIELQEHFGVLPESIVSLQLAEILGCSRIGEREGEVERKTRLGKRLGVWKLMKKRDAAFIADLHVMFGIKQAMSEYEIASPIEKLKGVKNSLFGDAALVLERPVQDLLLSYVLTNVRMIAQMFAHFTAADIVPIGDAPALEHLIALSTRYVGRNGIVGRVERNPFYLDWLLSLDALTSPLEGAVVCQACKAYLPLTCFEHATSLRREQCRACVVAALSDRTGKAHREAAKDFRETWI